MKGASRAMAQPTPQGKNVFCRFNMVRNYQRKSDRATNTNIEKLETAAKMVKDDGTAVRAAARAQGVDRSTLARYLISGRRGYDKCAAVKKVFTSEQELLLAEHVKLLDNRCVLLTYMYLCSFFHEI
jgi:hypothetical protein